MLLRISYHAGGYCRAVRRLTTVGRFGVLKCKQVGNVGSHTQGLNSPQEIHLKTKSMMDLNYTVRQMTSDDVPDALEVWRRTGMQEPTHCMYTWLAVDGEAFNVAVNDKGEIIAVCGSVIHGPDFAFLGLYCCLEEYRGHGIAKKVWDACVKHVGSRNAGLNAVESKLDMYRDKGGFSVLETRWACVVNETDRSINHEALSDEVPDGVVIEPFRDNLMLAISEYDLALVGYDRKLALELNCKEVGTKTLVAMKNGKCVGFGTIKTTCRNCGMIGPLYADEAVVAEVMLRRLSVSLPQTQGFAMMTLSNNFPANALVKKIGCPTTGRCPRLYRKEKMEIDTNKVFAHWDLGFSPF